MAKSRDGAKWTVEDIKQMKALARIKTPENVIADILGRRLSAVVAKAAKEKIVLHQMNLPTRDRPNR